MANMYEIFQEFSIYLCLVFEGRLRRSHWRYGSCQKNRRFRLAIRYSQRQDYHHQIWYRLKTNKQTKTKMNFNISISSYSVLCVCLCIFFFYLFYFILSLGDIISHLVIHFLLIHKPSYIFPSDFHSLHIYALVSLQ